MIKRYSTANATQLFWPQDLGWGCFRGASHWHDGSTRRGQRGLPSSSSSSKCWTCSFARSEAQSCQTLEAHLVLPPCWLGNGTTTPPILAWESAAEMGWQGMGREARKVETLRRKHWLGWQMILAQRENPNLALSGLHLNGVAIPFPNQKDRSGLQGEQQSMLWCLRCIGFKKLILYLKKTPTKKEMCLKF